MPRPRWIQLVSLLLAAAFLVAATQLVAPIEARRSKPPALAQDAVKNLPPIISLAVGMGGPLRGLAVQYLWTKAEQLDRDGKWFAAYQMAQWITALMPYYPSVWTYQAFQMAYNISVHTNTPQERWEWVNKGIALLRDQGLAYNPGSTKLYSELGYIFWHKVGGDTDDMHRYYKSQLAAEWHRILGPFDPATPDDQKIANFKTIADAPDSIDQLRRQNPAASRLLDQLAALNLKPDVELVRSFGRLDILVHSYYYKTSAAQAKEALDTYPPLVVKAFNDPAQRPALDAILATLRKSTLVNTYHMNPRFMLRLMLPEDQSVDGKPGYGFGPLNWQHPASHSLYWAALGVQNALAANAAAGTRLNDQEFLNVERLVLHSLQLLAKSGRIRYDVDGPAFDPQPDLRFVALYDKELQRAMKLEAQGLYPEHVTQPFSAGHENLLLDFVTFAWLNGDNATADALFKQAASLYAHEYYNINSGRYNKPVEEVALARAAENLDTPQGAGSFISSRIYFAFTQALLAGNDAAYQSNMHIAQQAHKKYQASLLATALTPDPRLGLPPFDEMVTAIFLDALLSPDSALSPVQRSQLWLAADNSLKQQLFPKFADQLLQRSAAYDLNPQAAFPPPPGQSYPTPASQP